MLRFKKIEPTLLKASNNTEIHLKQLEELKPRLNTEGLKLLERDIQLLEYGLIGENNVEFELMNSHLPIYVLKDVYLTEDNLTAQIDFLVFTNKIMVVIESKNLFGNITIDSHGNFIRSLPFRNKTVKEGIYSPITQNKRHFDLIKKKLVSAQKNIVMEYFINKDFEDFCFPLVVLANPKTILNHKYASKSIKRQIIRADQLINMIKTLHNNSKSSSLNAKTHLQWATNYLNAHQEKENTFLVKYQSYLIDNIETNHNNQDLKDSLIKYRTNTYQSEKIKAYYVFTNAQLDKMVENRPNTLEKLQSITSFKDNQIKKYGKGIIEIIKRFS